MTIDGPSGAGKTTVSRRLAQKASMTRLDTGAMYRACALAAKRYGIPWSDAAALEKLCAGLDISFEKSEGAVDARIKLNGEDVSEAIRTPEISMGASEVSVHKAVREAMVSLQRKMGEAGGTVLEGRDTGTVVFPNAEVKIFLDASAAVRARRRYREWKESEGKAFEDVLREVLERDVRDSTRENSLLRVPPGAVYIDSSTMTVDQVVDECLEHLAKFKP